MIAAGERIGPSTAAFFQAVIDARPHPEQGFRTCLGILALVKSYGAERLDAACRRGILIKARSVASIRSILQNGLIARSSTNLSSTSPCATATSADATTSTEARRDPACLTTQPTNG
ncbi:transposase [Bradyrhizobium diazoefficiens]